jgi:sulfofructose kinase
MHFPLQVRDDAEFDVVGFGTNAVDHLIRVAEYPAFNSKVEFSHYERSAGGEVASTLVGLQRLGMRTAYAGRFGDDAEGKFGLQTLIDEGVDVRDAEVIAGASTQTAFVLIDEMTGERTVIWRRDPALGYAAPDAPLSAAARCRILHMTTHDAEACILMARKAKENGVVVSVDVDRLCEGLDELLPLVDVLISSADFPEKATGVHELEPALQKLHERYGCSVTGATLGSEGSVFYCAGGFIKASGYTVPGGCRDTTGAGDAFRAGLLYGILMGQTTENAAHSANAVAALKCRMPGARAGLPSATELTAFIKNS